MFADDIIQDLSEKYDRSPAQIVLKWAVENNVVVLPKSTSPEHVRQNSTCSTGNSTPPTASASTPSSATAVYDTGIDDWDNDTYGISQ